ncbi:Protein of unknown function [Gryllus bimaculatus]|nr:Protein of unknown function [Gryllus bimaculatus]
MSLLMTAQLLGVPMQSFVLSASCETKLQVSRKIIMYITIIKCLNYLKRCFYRRGLTSGCL